MWGPMAASIVSGLVFSSILTLFLIPVLYEFFMRLPEEIQKHGGLWASILVFMRFVRQSIRLLPNRLIKRSA